MEQNFLGIADWKDILIIIVLTLLGMGTLLPVFLLGIFMGISAEKKAEPPIQPNEVKEYIIPQNSPIAQNVISWYEIDKDSKRI